MKVELKAGERLDDLQRNGLQIIQKPGKFCFGMDAVLLSGFAAAKPGERVLDLGTGTGIIPLLLSAKTQAAELIGLEIQHESAEQADRSVRLNNLQDRIRIVEGDLKEAVDLFGASSFDVVTANPPYMIDSHGLKNPDEALAIARHEVLCSLEDVISQAARVLKPGGHFYMVHRPFRLAQILSLMVQYRLEPKRLRLVYPRVEQAPNMVLLEGVRGAKSRMTVEKPLIVYDQEGNYMPEIFEIYGY